ncbi:pyruvate phosphate dikinase [Ferrithrix thermotolerans DSM 19514]|uniref:Pyruvate, phosphate dikinase n=1 Tax=Ferrithrix thermotolerans DSM 19514 TaxID=1121881 RepID=A0A1M4USE2_9ACTN|nr:pyruvate, phosphate dikinase [Ferrithrix thermotolerans]SHE59614.1 pyruvate phosphate dikinase [Ferrithrix thermotolerans DSM 19514]
MRYIYPFDFHHERAPMEMKDLLGGKGANLAEMTSVLKLPVPHGFTISTDACREYLKTGWPVGLDDELEKALSELELKMGRRLGDPNDPLLVSVRSGAKFSMPGMMDTVLNLGLNDESVEGLAEATNDQRFAYDSYRRFIQMYSRIVLGLDPSEMDLLFEETKEKVGAETDADVPVDALKSLIVSFKEIVERETSKEFPSDPTAQLKGAISAVFGSWNGERAKAYRRREGISDDLGTAVNVQAMVFGNRDNNSGTGVGFTRDPATGEKGIYGDFLVNAQGEDVVAGVRNTEHLVALKDRFPEVFDQLVDIFHRLESHYRDMCDTEFTIEQGKLWMLQTRVGKRTGVAALKMAVEMTQDEWIKLNKTEAVLRITGDHLDQVLHPQFADDNYKVLTKGLGASPGAAVGKVCFSSYDAVLRVQHGEKVILVRKETSPDDVQGMLAAQGVLTTRGGLVSHAAVVARGWGKPAVVGAEAIKVAERFFQVGETTVHDGDIISIDGTSGEVVLGAVRLSAAEPTSEFNTILSWADEIRRSKLAVRANADNGEDATVAAFFGAEGIGLCRTEHMFLREDRLPIVRRMILADTEDEEAAALEELRVAQRDDFLEILRAMSGLPVTVRLLDPPLHEFLPDVEHLMVKQAVEGLSEEEERLLGAARSWHEVNPMLGTRGVRLGVIKPGLYAMQVRALVQAAQTLRAEGGDPKVEIMVPLVVGSEELKLARSWAQDVIDELGAKDLDITIGTMIETPRAAIRAQEIATFAEFFSFGTNDLTQMTFGFSRDDVEGRLMSSYLEKGLLHNNPFKVVDPDGVGELVRMGIERGRSAKSDLKVGVCGEHGGDPASIETFYEAGVSYVSCSPYRVPIARLSAAHAVLRSKR